MKAVIGNIVSIIIENEEKKSFEWKEILVKVGVLAVSIYLIVSIDMIVYGYLTR